MSSSNSKKRIFKQIDSGAFPFEVLVILGGTKEQALKDVKAKWKIDKESEKVFLEEEGAGLQEGRTIMLSGGGMILWMNKVPNTNLHMSILAHEIMHLVEFLFLTIGIEHHDCTSEVWAYQYQHYFKQIIDLLDKK